MWRSSKQFAGLAWVIVGATGCQSDRIPPTTKVCEHVAEVIRDDGEFDFGDESVDDCVKEAEAMLAENANTYRIVARCVLGAHSVMDLSYCTLSTR